jgi:hypothetical protein
MQLFYMANIWIKEYWLELAKFVEKDVDNKIQIYLLYSIN